MKKTGKMVIEDRDLAFLFLDPTGIEEAAGGIVVDVDVAGDVVDWEDEDTNVWLTDETCSKFRVVKREVLGDNKVLEKDLCPMPTPVVIADAAAWQERKEEFGF